MPQSREGQLSQSAGGWLEAATSSAASSQAGQTPLLLGQQALLLQLRQLQLLVLKVPPLPLL